MADQDGMRLFWVQLSLLLPCLIFTGLRIYVRAVMGRDFSADDWIIVFATLLYVGSSSITMRGAAAGAMGQEHGTFSAEKLKASLKGIFLCEVFYPPMTLAIRLSVCLFLLRIVTRRVHRYTIHALLVTVSLASVAYFLTLVFQCVPPSYFWNQIEHGAEGHCLSQGVLISVALIHGSISALSAWVVGLLPIVMLWNVRMDLRSKITVIVLLGMSLIAGITLIVRLTMLRSTEFLTSHYFHVTMRTALWSMIEPSVGIIAASVPTLRPLFRKLTPKSSRSHQSMGRNARSRVAVESKSRWLELTARDARDDELMRNDSKEEGSASSAGKGIVVWTTSVAQGDIHYKPPREGISIQTSIEVTSTIRD
ncbi:hypothetical protein DCS_05586 [Drechmeria coniospora]|uniref:Rhodopsin domain-containing protein n=1 Tax=Drechmeria coniospora TaxID=98403 RepID=A0A151GN86_DRECN|nr:hypothetical protein DCS_05586 [Drechmeria coniospora]KYK58569.1 hypothetical protein DCS_05586 [Drechmeria coniospora]ODA83933.1 hypothetical protein RJ55_02450 [Drechmeria coniospora]